MHSYSINHIVFDLDGTLLNNKMKLSKFTKKGLERIIDKGIICSIITGRSLINTVNLLNSLNFSYFACCNGAIIYNKQKKEIEKVNYVSNDVVNELIDVFKKENIVLNIYKKDEVYTTKKAKFLMNQKYQEIIKAKEITYFHPNEVLMLEVIDEDNKFVKKVKNCFLKKYNKLITVVNAGFNYFQITKKGINKLYALSYFSKKLNTSFKNTAVFGDSQADYKILKKVGVAVLMKNHSLPKKFVKKKFLITDLDNKEDGAIKFALNLLNIKIDN